MDQKGREERKGEMKDFSMKAILEGFFVSRPGTQGTAARTWTVAQDSAMCPTDGPSKYEGT